MKPYFFKINKFGIFPTLEMSSWASEENKNTFPHRVQFLKLTEERLDQHYKNNKTMFCAQIAESPKFNFQQYLHLLEQVPAIILLDDLSLQPSRRYTTFPCDEP